MTEPAITHTMEVAGMLASFIGLLVLCFYAALEKLVKRIRDAWTDYQMRMGFRELYRQERGAAAAKEWRGYEWRSRL